MSEFEKGFWAGLVFCTLVLVLIFGSVQLFFIYNSSIPACESLTIEYKNPKPYERSVAVELENSITNSFKNRHYHMDKHSYKLVFSNPIEK